MRPVTEECPCLVYLAPKILQYFSRADTEFMNDGSGTCICELPLLAGAVDIALVEEIAETLLEPRLRCSAHERVNIRGAKIAVLPEELEYLDIARRHFDPLGIEVLNPFDAA